MILICFSKLRDFEREKKFSFSIVEILIYLGPIVNCPYGKGGDCGGFANTPCQSGYTCKYPTKPFCSLGTCCKDKPVGKFVNFHYLI